MPLLLLTSIFVIATCGLIYELLAGAIASYLLGDSVTQFSTIIGTYLFAMGIGSYFSKFFKERLLFTFVQVELLIGLIGGCSAAILFVGFEVVSSFRWILYFLVVITGTLVGLEIPLLMRILKDQLEFRDLVSKVFTFDYIGALFASLLFPLVLVPHLGLVRTGFLFGILNVLVGLVTLYLFEKQLRWAGYLKMNAYAFLAILIAGFVYSQEILEFSETAHYADPVIYTQSTPYQRIVLTRDGSTIKLFLNSNLQFSSQDEHRYHEALVHTGLARLDNPKRVLVLGGGDGLAIREVLKYPTVETITLVELDPAMTQLFDSHPLLTQLNSDSLRHSRVKVINQDAFKFLTETVEPYDFVIVDFPDPSNFSVGKLYTTTFYERLKKVLKPESLFVIQSTSPYYAKESFWCIVETISATGFKVFPYHTLVPSFGDWGFVLGGLIDLPPLRSLPENLRFIDSTVIADSFHFPKDQQVASSPVNKLNNQILVHLFEKDWGDAL